MYRIGTLAVVLLALGPGGCEAGFEPMNETRTEFFAVFGFLDAGADTQFVRVSPIRPLLDPASGPAGTAVSSTLLSSGERVAWLDSLVRLDDGSTGLLFYAPFRPAPGGSYLLQVRDAEGNVTEALTRVPPAAPLQQDDVLFSGGDLVQPVTWLGVMRQPVQVSLAYLVRLPGARAPETLFVPFSQTGALQQDGWRYVVNLSDDSAEIARQLGRPNRDGLTLEGIQMKIDLRSEEWQQREAPANIRNGFGFFGAVGASTQRWMLDSTTTVRLGYTFVPGR